MESLYTIICSEFELEQYLSGFHPDIQWLEEIPTPDSYPALLELTEADGGIIDYQYTEVCDLEGATRKYYVDQDPEYSVLLDVAREMMFTNSRIEDSTKGV